MEGFGVGGAQTQTIACCGQDLTPKTPFPAFQDPFPLSSPDDSVRPVLTLMLLGLFTERTQSLLTLVTFVPIQPPESSAEVPVSLLHLQTRKGKPEGQTEARECSGSSHRVLHENE